MVTSLVCKRLACISGEYARVSAYGQRWLVWDCSHGHRQVGARLCILM